MRNRISLRTRGGQFIALSLALHLAVTTFLFLHRSHPVVVVTPAVHSQIRFYPAMLAIPGGNKAAEWTRNPPGRKKRVSTPPKLTTDLAVNTPPAPPLGAPVSAQHDPVPGSGLDTQSADPAFPVFSPHPPVTDRALLPEFNRQVIVDVKVSAAGDVLEATLVQGLGNALDQIVLDTVKTWRFHPATLNGSPVATEAELVFPFDEKYPTTTAQKQVNAG